MFVKQVFIYNAIISCHGRGNLRLATCPLERDRRDCRVAEKWVKIPTDDSRDDSIKAAIYGDKVEKVEVGGDGELNIEYEPYDDEE